MESLFVGDHHALGTSYLQNVPTLARLTAAWDREIGALFVLPLWHPVLLAEQVGTLSAMSDGPFVLITGLGYGEREFDAMGVRLGQRRRLFEESLPLVRSLLAGEHVDHDGTWKITSAAIAPVPAVPPSIWIAGGAPAVIDRAARMGDGWLAGPGLNIEEAEAQLRLYREALDRHGRRADRIAIRRDVHVGADGEDAARAVASVVGGYRGLARDALIVGDVDDVSHELERLQGLGFTDVLVRHIAPRLDDVLTCTERLAEVRSRLAASVAPVTKGSG